MLEVCCAIILCDPKILAVQRGLKSNHPLKWEFPGGKINPGETVDECIIREIEEELSVKIEIIKKLLPIEFDYQTKQIQLIPVVCRIISGEIRLTEHADKRWFSFDEWESIDWLGADRELIVRNQEILNSLLPATNL